MKSGNIVAMTCLGAAGMISAALVAGCSKPADESTGEQQTLSESYARADIVRSCPNNDVILKDSKTGRLLWKRFISGEATGPYGFVAQGETADQACGA